MMVETTKEDICINGWVGQKVQMITCEGDVIIPDVKPDIVSWVNASGNVCVYKKEISEGKIRFDGSVSVYIMYLADSSDSVVRGINTTLDFSELIDFDGVREGMNIDEQLTLKSIDCRVLNGRKVNISANIEVKINAYANENTSLVREINNVEDMQVLSKTIEINSLLGTGTSRAYAKETISLDSSDNLAEILCVHTRFLDKDTKPSYNKILAKADFEVKIMYLTEDNRIGTVNSKIPVMGFVDVQEVTDTSMCNTKYGLKNIIIKPNSTEEHSIYVEAEVELTCNVYENRQIDVIQDLYSPSRNVEFNEKSIETNSRKSNITETCNIRENISIPDIGDNRIYDVEVTPNILSERTSENRILYEGEVEARFIFDSNNVSGLDTRNVSIPFTFEVNNQGVTTGSMLETEIEVRRDDFVVNAGNVSVNIDLGFNIGVLKNERLNIIDEINMDEASPKESYSMIVYFVKPSDTLWKIAKKFGSTIEDIARVNEIGDINKIDVGKQLFIPRYSSLKAV